MQKRTKKDMNLWAGETLLDYFIRNTTDKSEKNMVQVMTHMNSFAFGQAEIKRKEIVDFGNYFMSNGFEAYSRDERIKAFGVSDAYVLNIYYKIFEVEERKRILEVIQDATASERFEAKTLTDEIFLIKGEKMVTLSTLDGPITFTYNKDNRKHAEILKQEFYNYMLFSIRLGNAGLVVRIKKKEKDLLLGIKIEGGIWRPLPVHEFIEEYVEGLDFSVRYTEIARKEG